MNFLIMGKSKNQKNNFWIIGKWKNQINYFLIIEKWKKYFFKFLIFRCFHFRGLSTNDTLLRKCCVFIGIWKIKKIFFWIIRKWKNQKMNFLITRIFWRYAPKNPSPCGGLGCGPLANTHDANDQTAAVHACKHLHNQSWKFGEDPTQFQ